MDGISQRRIGAYGVRVGVLPPGPLGKISDVPGVRVGHCTLEEGPLRTGTTVILPGRDNPFYRKPVAASHVLNGYGKSLGLVQVDELGTIETPIALCGTLNVGLVHDALVSHVLRQSEAEGRYPTSINPVVMECHDGRLSDIVRRPVHAEHVEQAIATACEDFEEGSVGAGRGMVCHGLKGGVGSASRLVEIGGKSYVVGLLAMTNHGRLSDLRIDGRAVGPALERRLQETDEGPERGSVILVLATDLPVDDRQLRRILRRTPVGLARLGSYVGHGSGEIVLGFTTANSMPFEEGDAVIRRGVLREDLLDTAFRAAAECCEEAVLNSMITADTTTGYRGDTVWSLRDLWPAVEALRQ